MRLSPHVTRCALALALTVLAAIPAGATTLIRQGLDKLTAENQSVVYGRVLDIHSYWNAEQTMIMTDVRFLPSQVLKGDRVAREITFTLLGGTVGETTTLVIAARSWCRAPSTSCS
ncbi:MAG: hypothetical protein ACRENJ_09350 [Candidatus Eiseniibacteriota bacterium]